MDTHSVPVEALSEAVKRPFLDIAPDISGALVYLDAGAGEVAHLSLGASFLLGLGAGNVCSLDTACSEDAQLLQLTSNGQNCTVLAIFLTRLLTDAHSATLKAIRAHPKVSNVIIFCSISETDHANQASTALGYEAYSDYTSHLLDDLASSSKQDPTQPPSPPPAIIIKHFPLNICALDDITFVLPAASSAVQLARAAGKAAGFGAADAFHDDSDGQGNAPGLALLAASLAAVAVQLGYRPDAAFHLGPVSHQVAHDLVHATALPGQDALSKRMAIVVVDRHLDLASPLLQQEHLVDAMMASLPRPATPSISHSAAAFRPVDVRVDAPQCYPTLGPLVPGQLLGLELFHPNDKRAQQQLQQLLARRGKEAAAQLRKWLKESLRQEGLQPSVRSKAGAVQPAELQALAMDLAANPGAAVRQRSVIALGLGAAQALSGDPAAGHEAAAGLQKQLLLALAEAEAVGAGSSSVEDFFLDACHSAQQHKGLITPSTIVQLLALAYSLAADARPPQPPLMPQQEQRVRAALLDALAAAADTPQQQLQQQQVDSLFASLQLALLSRSKFKDYARLRLDQDEGAGVGTVTPLLRQLVSKLQVRAEQRDLQQARQRQGVVSGFMKGLMKGGQQEVALHEFDAVMVFVVGGLSLVEVREVRQELEQPVLWEKQRVVLGGSGLLSPADVAGLLLG